MCRERGVKTFFVFWRFGGSVTAVLWHKEANMSRKGERKRKRPGGQSAVARKVGVIMQVQWYIRWLE
jgi:hypothetical protein